ncbi:MAG: acetyl-coenzyme A synthetase N-terminal domain-containing protein [Terriglobia bacterium]
MNQKLLLDGPIVWRPSPHYLQRSHLMRFMNLHQIDSFAKLYTRSIEDVSWFTDSVIRYLDIRFQSPYQQILDLSRGIEFPKWCVGGKLNISYNCVDKWADDPATRNRLAIISEGEEGHVTQLTYGELATKVNQCANALRALGLGKGDSVGLLCL